MRYLSVCSGIEAASVAWDGLGFEPAGLSEIEPFPCAVLSHRFPNVRNFGDMTNYKEWKDVGAVDVVVGGTPCQSFSVAGLRKGITDPRGNLMLTFGAIADHFKAKWLVWENVPGVLSSNGGRDFGSLLGMLAQFGYGFAYRVLDAQFFGVPQRRRRVFVVGYLGDWRPPAAVLFESDGLQGNHPPCRIGGEGFAFNAQGSASQGLSAGRTSPTLDKSKVHAVCYENHSQDSRINGCNHESPIVVSGDVLRRFTPLEYERLQGFPDNWTQIPWKGKSAEQCPDNHRYKACGNSMAVPVMRWIGKRIIMVEKMLD